jgi:hypothetical protein
MDPITEFTWAVRCVLLALVMVFVIGISSTIL